jgi:hypothetical protein
MNNQTILAILKAFGINEVANTIVALVTVQLAINPGATDAQLLSQEDGTIKHAIRGKIGWAIDIIWPFVGSYVDQAITQAIATVRASATPIADPPTTDLPAAPTE